MHRIVIVGGGAGGLELATRLGDKLGRRQDVEVLLVDRSATHVWKPLLHEVAAGRLDTHVHQIEYAAQARWHRFEFHRGSMTGLNRSRKEIMLGPVHQDGAPALEIIPGRIIRYDTLVLALGSQTHFFGVEGAERNAVTLDCLEQAEKLRKRLLQTCVRNYSRGDARVMRNISLAIIGGGATGVELAAELRTMEKEFRRFGLHSSAKDDEIRITLLEAGPRILPALPDDVSSATAALLARLSIDVSVGDPVTRVEPDQVHTSSGRVIDSDVTIWAAGIRAPDVLSTLDGLSVNRMNQVIVSETLQSVSDENIFALGDCASCAWSDGRMVPPRAQAAHQQAMFLSRALRARLNRRSMGAFKYSDHGSLVSVGPAAAVGVIAGLATRRGMLVKGPLARLLYSTLYRKHLAAVSGVRRTIAGLVSQQLRKLNAPRIKLH
jgi:NADH:ubiquinone reductase (H+-translocating)